MQRYKKILITTKNNAKNTLKIKKNKQLCLQTVVSSDLSSRFCIAGKLMISLLLGIGFSIDTPYQLHIKSIVSMEYRWRNDGVTMEYLRRKKGFTRVEQCGQRI